MEFSLDYTLIQSLIIPEIGFDELSQGSYINFHLKLRTSNG
jgi:hypothetical protein